MGYHSLDVSQWAALARVALIKNVRCIDLEVGEVKFTPVGFMTLITNGALKVFDGGNSWLLEEAIAKDSNLKSDLF